jgi:hypothetical protein
MARIYLAQTSIDRWLSAGHAQLEGDRLRLDAGGTPFTLHLEPACYVQEVDGGEPDPHQLLGKVLSLQDLAAKGGEQYETSALVGDTPYVVEPGFLAHVVGPDGVEQPLDPSSWSRLRIALEVLQNA